MTVNRTHRNRLALALAAALLLPTTAFAQQQDATQEETKAKQAESEKEGTSVTLDKVSVVGSRIKRAEIEGPAPITVISRADIDREGFQTVGDMLQSLTQQSTANFTGDLAVTGFTPNAQVINLRGMGPGYTLTLVDGRRPPQYPQPYNRDNNVVNVKAIPSAMVERIEVLTGGASAIYGSDAVAGVVNIVTRKHFDGKQLRLTTGTTQEGGGDSVNLEFVGGKSGDRWDVQYSMQFTSNEPIFANQRHTYADTRNNPYGISVNPSLSLVAISGAGLAGPRNHNVLYNEAACQAFGYTTVTTPTRGKYCGSFNQVASRSLYNKNQAWAGYTSGTFNLTDNTQLFASATYYTTDAKSSSGTEFWSTSSDKFTQRNGAASNYYYDANLKDLVLIQRVFNPFELGGNEAAATLYDETSWGLTFGANGTFADRFDWEGSFNYGKYNYEADRPRLLAKAVHDYFLGPLLGTFSGYQVYALNQARWNSPITPEIYRSFSTRVKNKAETTSSTLNFNVSGDLFTLPAGPVGFAAVLEGTRQTTDLVSDPRTNQLRPLDDQTIYNLTSSGETHGKRDRYAAGLEFHVPIFSNLSVNLAGRYDKYDDITAVDTATTYNFGIEYRPFSNLLLRGSYATSFRAPDMQLVFAEGAASYSGVFDEYACRSGNYLGQVTGPRTVAQCGAQQNDVTSYTTQSVIAGNPLLKEEEGESWGYGFVWDIVDNLSVSVDYYHVKLRDQSTAISSGYLTQNEANCRLGVKRDGSAFEHASDSAFCQNIYGLITRTSAPGTALDGRIERLNTAYINSALTEVSGIDSSLRYTLSTDRWGRFGFDIGHTIRLTNKFQQFSEDPIVDYRDSWDYDPRSRVRGSIAWSKDNWSASLFGSRLGENWNWAETERMKPYITYNLQVGRKLGANTNVDFTVVNLTNNQFRFDPTYTSYPYFYSYVGADPMGRRFYLSIKHTF